FETPRVPLQFGSRNGIVERDFAWLAPVCQDRARRVKGERAAGASRVFADQPRVAAARRSDVNRTVALVEAAGRDERAVRREGERDDQRAVDGDLSARSRRRLLRAEVPHADGVAVRTGRPLLVSRNREPLKDRLVPAKRRELLARQRV